MEGITIDEMSRLLKLPQKTVAIRIHRAGIKPMTRQAVYSLDTIEKIKEVKMGRPKKQPDKPAKKPDSRKGK
jgi:RNA:NAD 2'-phosphotransferase (TPT1/KptA family)